MGPSSKEHTTPGNTSRHAELFLTEPLWTPLTSPSLLSLPRYAAEQKKGAKLLSRFGVASTPLLKDAFATPLYHDLHRDLTKQGVPEPIRTPLLLDAAYYISRHQPEKLDLIRHVLSTVPQEAPTLLHQLSPLLRRVDSADIRSSFQGASTSEELLDHLKQVADQHTRPFYTHAQTININWQQFFKQYGEPLAQAATSLLTDLGIKTKSRPLLVGTGEKAKSIPLILPHDFRAFRRTHHISSDQYFAGLTHYLYDQLTQELPLPVVDAKLNHLLTTVYALDPISLPERAQQEASLTRNLWTFVLDTLKAHPEQRYLLWLNESTTPRYFGRDQVDRSLAQRIRMVQAIPDRRALEFLGHERQALREAARTKRAGQRLSTQQHLLLGKINQHFRLNRFTRVLPLHEVKMKSGHNDHQIQKTAPVMDDLIDLAELLDMHIIFADISENPVGRSQRYVRAFMQSRSVPTTAEGRLARGFAQDTPEDQIVNDMPISEVFASVPPDEDRSQTHVQVIQYDPNEAGLTPTADDATWLTVRNKIAKTGLYAPTRSPAVIPQLTGFVSAEDYWRSLIVPHALADLISPEPPVRPVLEPLDIQLPSAIEPTASTRARRAPWFPWPRRSHGS